MLRNYHCALLSSSIVHSVLYLAEGTEIKWKGTSHGDDPAKSAPKSQRYWDEHNIERPDYAKTDAEIAAERGETPPIYTTVVIMILLIVFAIYVYREKANGQRLGGSGTGVMGISLQSASGLDEARAREARLARFDNQNGEAGKND